ncbi:PIN domain-containing protein [Algoriphagus marinus]|uniref:PIN domain-containing protein n=1 Tax=Algoriphagus marinus TaxID=1925762 RepID=UPI00094BB2B3|nr:PIN domain-containing protein [Algoriphagus marinus]
MKIVALLDACVIYPAPIRDLLLSFADAGLFKPKWTIEIHDEWTRNLIENRSDLEPKRIRRTVDMMDEAFPDALVEDYENNLQALELPDPDDRHVLAAAIYAESKYLVTANLKDFPLDQCLEHGINPIHPDDFTLLLLESSMEVAFECFKQMVARLKTPPQKIEQVLETLEKCGLVKTAEYLTRLNQRENLAF